MVIEARDTRRDIFLLIGGGVYFVEESLCFGSSKVVGRRIEVSILVGNPFGEVSIDTRGDRGLG